MNLSSILSIFRGGSIYETIAQTLTLIAGFIAGVDSNKDGNDDLLAGGLVAVSSGILAYGRKDDNEHGNIVDGILAALTEYRRQMVDCGKIFPVDNAPRPDLKR